MSLRILISFSLIFSSLDPPIPEIMSSSRPKRKAATNKNYTDLANDALFKELTSTRAEKPSVPKKNGGNLTSKAKSPTPPNVSFSNLQNLPPRVPYNWQPPLFPQDFFSNKLNLDEAYIDTSLQTLYCPHQPPAIPGHWAGDLESDHLQKMISAVYRPTPETSLPQPGTRRRANARDRSSDTCFHLSKGDYIYMISEPPGEPYYIGRIMGFDKKDTATANIPTGEDHIHPARDFRFLIQWFYRPRDISKHSSDSRLLYASMHSDTCPLASYRGMVTVKHKLEIDHSAASMEQFVSQPNCFYFDKLFDRYMIKFYDIVKTLTLLPYVENTANDSANYLLALNKRFEFVFMESSKTKAFIDNFGSTLSSNCDICGKWCNLGDSVTCAGCDKHFHMYCLDPPLLKKPSRGFSWSCAKCAKKHELEYQRRKMVMLSHDNRSTNEEELRGLDPDDLDPIHDDDDGSNKHDSAVSEKHLPKYERMAIDYLANDKDVSVATRRLREEWCMRYLGIHTRLEDAVDPDDRSPYPRASTNLGAKYQASNIPEYVDHPIVYYDSETPEGKPKKSKKTPTKKSAAVDEKVKKLPIPKEFEGVSPRDFPQWLQPRPKGYIERGVDDGSGETALLMWKPREEDQADNFHHLDQFITLCQPFAENLGIFPNSPNFMDALLKIYMDCNGDTSSAIDHVAKLTRKDLREPTLSKEEIKRFESGVKKYGSELYPTYKEVKTQPCLMIVRFYYLWKKSKKGKQIWGSFPGRKKSKLAQTAPEHKADDFADIDDDSSYENDKIIQRKRLFRCKHCKTYRSLQWFKITGFDGNAKYEDMDVEGIDRDAVTALCFRCAKLWRRYAVYWEDPLEVERKYSKTSGGYRRKVEAELLFDARGILSQAEREGGGLSYDSDKILAHNGSVLFLAAPVNGALPVMALDGMPVVQPPARVAKAPVVKKDPLPAKRESEAVVAPAAKKRKTPETNKTNNNNSSTNNSKSNSKSNSSTENEKPTKPTKAESNSKKRSPANGVPVVKMEEGEPKTKKTKKQATPDATFIPRAIFNENYRHSLPRLATVENVDKKTYPVLNSDTVEEIIGQFKARQLLDLLALASSKNDESASEIPQESQLCGVCLIEDASETLIGCLRCGGAVHGSCAGISIPAKQKATKQWLCEGCLNDMNPHYTEARTCCLCYSKTKRYLVPIVDSGRWCHLVCAMFSSPRAVFRGLHAPSFMSKDVVHSGGVRSIGRIVETVDPVYMDNFRDQCGICGETNGAMMACGGCSSSSSKIHVACAQETNGYELAFRISTVAARKPSTTTFVGSEQGKLEPVLIRSSHDHKHGVYGLREHGRRTPTGEPKPLMNLFLEDIVRTVNPRANGPQLKALNYIALVEQFARGSSGKENNGDDSGAAVGLKREQCTACGTSFSPRWWGHGDAVKCQSCHHSRNTEAHFREGDLLREELCRPLDGAHHGIRSPADVMAPAAVGKIGEAAPPSSAQ